MSTNDPTPIVSGHYRVLDDGRIVPDTAPGDAADAEASGAEQTAKPARSRRTNTTSEE